MSVGETRAPKLERPKRLVFTGRILSLLVGLVVISTVLAYLSWQFSALAADPQLDLTSPASDQAITGEVVDIDGHTTPGSDISINGSPVLTDTDGNFSEKVALQDGVNPIRIVSKSKLGKATTVIRNVLATLPKVDVAQAAVPTAPFPGVAVAINVTKATSIIVAVDGKEVWRGTTVAGWSKTFTGTNDINITTGNAGATSAIITNAAVASKKISPLGQDGEIRRNQDFTKDTVIQ